MDDDKIKQIINDTVDIAILKMRAAGILKEKGKTAFDKTEALLFQYPDLCKSDQPYAKKVVAQINSCLADIEQEPYAKTITLFYFEHKTNEAVANELFCDERTARRQRRKLVDKFAARLASDEFIRELLL